jgi:KaiC/GvpD/RAD55 family RecA-like ATPase
MVERIPTGIPELDDMLSGGFPQPSNILVKGPPGGFKTILCLQILYNAARRKSPGLYVTFNQKSEGIKEQARQFGWNFDGLPAEFVSFDTTLDADLEVNAVKEAKANIVVVDSLTSFLSRPPITRTEYQADPMIDAIKKFPGIRMSEDALIRAMTTRLIRKMSQTNATNLFIYEDQTLEGIRAACEYLVDGVLRLARVESIGKRTLTIEKMRYTKHDFLPRTIMLKEKGVTIER